MKTPIFPKPFAITMWDFSWLERRWPGAGYEDWDLSLDELAERGYDSVRIDAYPHLIAADPKREWSLQPAWNTQDWGAPARVKVSPMPALIEFIEKCAERKIKVGLSTWFRQDEDNMRMRIVTPEQHGAAWLATLNHIEKAGLMDAILYVDLCNEWTHSSWAPVFNNRPPYGSGDWNSPASLDWMRRAIAVVRGCYPEMPLTFSTNTHPHRYAEVSVEFLDFLEPHLWMASANTGDFYKRVGYRYELFDPKGYENLTQHGEPTYRANEQHWLGLLEKVILTTAAASEKADKMLVTTEAWSVVDYKDWPGLDWGWVKEGCEFGVKTALSTGRWRGMCTSNFCGPQFCGMWREVAWHQKLTKMIRHG